jgi:hypothetical protein
MSLKTIGIGTGAAKWPYRRIQIPDGMSLRGRVSDRWFAARDLAIRLSSFCSTHLSRSPGYDDSTIQLLLVR